MKLGIVFICVLVHTIAFSQKLESSLSSSFVLIGEPFTITYKVTFEENSQFDFIPFKKEIPTRFQSDTNTAPSLEIISDFNYSNPNKNTWVGKYEVVCWDSATVIITGPEILIADSKYNFEDLTVMSSFTEKEAGKDLYDIREKFEKVSKDENVEKSFFAKFWWLFALLAFIVLILILYYLKKRKTDVLPKKTISLEAKTLMSIEALNKEKLWEKDRLKDHYVELSYILRRYLSARFDLSLMELTSYEIRSILNQKAIPSQNLKEISEVLTAADIVKYADSKPEVFLILKVSDIACKIVKETSPKQIDNVE